MITVACISCSHQYSLDERRLAATGLKMRCPKCGTSFMVFPDGRTEEVVQKNTMLGGAGAPAPPPPKVPAPPKPVVPPPAMDDLDLDLPAPRGAAPSMDDELDLPAPRGAKIGPASPGTPAGAQIGPASPGTPAGAKPAPKGPIAPPFGGDDMDLPAPRGAVAKPARPSPPKAPSLADDLDLPAPRGAKFPVPAGAKPPVPPPKKPIAPPMEDLDLPAPRGAKPAIAPPLEIDLPAPRGAKPVIAPPMEDLDLPAPRGAKPAIAPPLEIDLPAPRGAKPAIAPPLDIDLPAPRKPGARAKDSLDMDLPGLRAAKPAAAPSLDELDLPAPRGAKIAPAGRGGVAPIDIDLPAPRQPQRIDSVKPALADVSRTPFDDDGGDDDDGLDLPAPSGKSSGLELDLPAPKGGGFTDLPAPKPSALAAADRAFGDLDLPMPKRGGAAELADLPAPRDAADLPALRGAADLPAVRGAGADLPALRGALDLPAPRGASDLPAVRGPADLPAVRGISDLPTMRRGPADLPTLPEAGAGFPELDLPPPRRAVAAPADQGDLDLPPPRPRGGAGPSIEEDLELPPPRKGGGARTSISEFELPVPEKRRSLAPRGHGEIDLPGGDGDMEFSDIPQERGSTGTPSRVDVERPRETQPKTLAKPADTRPRSRRGIYVALGLILVIAGVGGALTFTPYGPFGTYFVQQQLHGGDPATVRAAMDSAAEGLRHDTPSSYRETLHTLAVTRGGAEFNRALLARSLYAESLARVRFGPGLAGDSAATIATRINQQGGDDPAVALGLAAYRLREGQASSAASLVARARAFAPNDPFVDLLDGEIALAEDRPADASQAFQAAIEHQGGAASRWGFARALSHGDDHAAYDAAIAATLEEAPDHVEALFARAVRLHETNDDDQAIHIASQVVGREPLGEVTLVSHARLRAEAWSLLGSIYEARGRTGQALDAYREAADADSSDMIAVLGEGRMLLLDRPSEALGRFEAVINTPDATTLALPSGRTAAFEARLGAARAMTQLDRVQEAHTTLTDLAAERPDDAEVQLWLGRVEEQLTHPELAEAHYQESVRLAPTVFEPYLALARLYDRAERTGDAVALLESARSAVPQTAQVHEQLGTYALSQTRLPEAEAEFRSALALDDALPAARFGLAVTLRRESRLEDAAAAFEQLAAVDPNHPGLALERGLLFEARHEENRAVEFYRQALTEHPDDASLELRLGGALVAVGQYDEAETTLAPVMQEVPPRAEAEFYTGRIAFARSLYPEAQQHFNRALGLDSTRGEFYMWAGWAALMANELGLAISRSEEAISHDASLGDAYYVRGVARLRTGMERDALVDLRHAVELSPTRYEALAAEGECYDHLRQLSDAITAYTRAVAAVDNNGEWWYRLGRLQLDASHTAESVHALSRATLIGDATTPRPAWLADAHRILADGMRLSGDRAGAVHHYQTYLSIAPQEAIDRDDVRSALMDLGVVPGSP